jgi:hypothetical protein
VLGSDTEGHPLLLYLSSSLPGVICGLPDGRSYTQACSTADVLLSCLFACGCKYLKTRCTTKALLTSLPAGAAAAAHPKTLADESPPGSG